MKKFNMRLTPLSIATFYACIGGIWLIFSSAKIITSLFQKHPAIQLLEVNSIGFILVSSWLLYFLIRKSESSIKNRKKVLEKLNRALKAYSECHQTLIRADNETQLMQNICQIIVEAGGYRVAWVGMADNDVEQSVKPVAQWGDTQGYLKNLNVSWSNRDLGRGPTGTAIKTGKPVIVKYIEYDPKWEIWRENALRHGFRSSISLPLISGGRPFGALVIFSGDVCAFDDKVKLLSELADDLAYGITSLRVAVENEKIQKEYRLLASVIEQAKECILLIDSTGIIQYVNPAVTTINSRSPRDMIGYDINTMICREPERQLYEAILKASFQEEHLADLFQYQHENGAMLELDVITWSVSDSIGNIISHVALIRDVSYEMQLESQLRRAQRMEAIGTLAGGIAHDFNNTLASVITCTEMALEESPEGSTLRELLDVVLKSGLRGKNLVKQILTFSRQSEQKRQEVPVDLVVNECLKLLRATLMPTIEIRLHIDKKIGLVFADPTQIQQIVMNLCTNAVHAMRGQAHGELDIWLDNVDNDVTNFVNLTSGPYLCMTVRDNGHGMDEKTIDRIFDPFFSTKGQSEGTGLGLSVIHGIVSNHGGAITVESKPGQGSQFKVYLPRMDTSTNVTADSQSTTIFSGTECILLVDDEEDLVFGTERMLKQLGYKVIARNDPLVALQLFVSAPEQFDLIITDQAMPHMNGTELARELTRIRPDIPVILCTGYDTISSGDTDDIGETAEFISELALKPLIRGEIASIIRRVLDSSPQNEGLHG
ncbi:MAG: GAF domain-containing protein [Desulfuromonadales bacterium]|nr:GAF domain-containing protein [Desulfuromonadales bacterium]